MKRKSWFPGMVAFVSLMTSGYLECRRVSAEEIKPRSVWKMSGPVFELAFSPDGKTLAVGIGRADQGRVIGHTALGGTTIHIPAEIQLWEAATGKEKFTISGDPPRQGLCFSPDGKTFVACGSVDKKGELGVKSLWDIQFAGVVKVWESQTGKEKLHLDQDRWVNCIAFSPDGKILATGSFDHMVRLLDLNTGKSLAVLRGHRKMLWCVAFSPDGKTLASGGYDEIVRLWDVATKKGMATLQGEDVFGPGKEVSALAFSPDGKRLAAGVDDGVKVWDVAAKKLVYKLQGKWCNSLAFSPDGKLLAWSAGDNVVRLWDVVSGKENAQLKGHTDSVHSIAFSPNGKTLASGSCDRTIQFWDIAAIMMKDK